MIYLLCHGFGFSNEYWRNLAPLLDGDVVFFGNNFDESAKCVGIGHSIGFQKLNNSGIKFDFLIGLQGFTNFCGNNRDLKKIREKNLDYLIGMLEKDPRKTLKFFYDTCRYPDEIPENIAVGDLATDLVNMKKSYDHCGCPTLVIGSDQDEIVPTSILDDNFRDKKNVIVEQINGAYHSLGFHKPREVFEKIKKFCR
ncbi:MAG: alpha/beta hydrolase [Holosporaceae bacterium]|jgi:pimeloyl-[acyl-carrier protein] methyl ester esterase|nr:alpha/beta hydrolase [Holosporaceae bacterium]